MCRGSCLPYITSNNLHRLCVIHTLDVSSSLGGLAKQAERRVRNYDPISCASVVEPNATTNPEPGPHRQLDGRDSATTGRCAGPQHFDIVEERGSYVPRPVI